MIVFDGNLKLQSGQSGSRFQVQVRADLSCLVGRLAFLGGGVGREGLGGVRAKQKCPDSCPGLCLIQRRGLGMTVGWRCTDAHTHVQSDQQHY